MEIVQVVPLADYKLKITFTDGVTGFIDLRNYVTTGVFSVLQDAEMFNKVYTNGYSVAWSEDLEIDALAIYAEVTNKPIDEILNPDVKYATN